MRSHTTLLGMVLVALGGMTPDAGVTAAQGDVCSSRADPGRDGSCVERPAGQSITSEPRMAALILAAGASGQVTIDGVEWRKAPAHVQARTGRAGSRIILDDELWLRADDPAFDRLPIAATRPSADAAVGVPREQRAPPSARTQRATAPPPESAESLRIRQRRLLAEARERRALLDAQAAAETSGRPTDRPTGVSPADSEAIARRIDSQPALGAALPAPDGERARAEAQARNAVALDRSVDVLAARSGATVRDRERAEAASRDAVAADAVAEQAAGEAAYAQTATVSALQLPYRASRSADRFSYLQLMPLGYDIGGAGVQVEGSGEVREYIRLLARAAIADRYSEALIGMGLFYTPPSAERLTLMLDAGYEYSVFPLENTRTGLKVDDASGGPFVNAGGRLVLSRRFVLEGGVGYSSFHQGDPIAFGSGFFQVNDVVDLMSRVELGDQDSYGIGIRVHY